MTTLHPNDLPAFDLCRACSDGSCDVCAGNGGWELGSKWHTCTACNGIGVCPECFGEVLTVRPFAGAILPILPNDTETWEMLLFPTPKE